MIRVRPSNLLSAGLAVAAGTALVPLALGKSPLDQQAVAWHFEVIGTVKFTTATVFDTGVYLIVVGLVLMIFEALGDDPDADQAPSLEDGP
jgi:multicomponent Na+:H+ antiporter subunit A